MAWRSADGALHAGPGACPHLGAALCDAPVHGDDLVCRWHGMPLGPGRAAGLADAARYDDGVLAWVRLGDERTAPTDGARARPAAARRRALAPSPR